MNTGDVSKADEINLGETISSISTLSYDGVPQYIDRSAIYFVAQRNPDK